MAIKDNVKQIEQKSFRDIVSYTNKNIDTSDTIIIYPFKKGDFCKVIAGPFIDFTGFVENVNEDKQKVKVTVSIFGRPTPIELDFFQVEVER